MTLGEGTRSAARDLVVRWLAVICVVALTACQFQPRGAESDASRGIDDATADATSIEPDADTTDASALDARPIDAAVDALVDASIMIDALACPLECSRCLQDGTCVIDCGSLQCLTGVTCPPGRPCQVNCIGAQACETGVVNCMQATSCNITCDGADACDAGVNCAGSSCTVTCHGNAACEDGGVDCTATTCEITCDGNLACRDHVCCAGADCDSNACQATNGGCCDCQGC